MFPDVLLFLLGLPWVFGYSRLRPDKVLDHEVRRRLLTAVREEPGLHGEALRRTLGIGRNTAAHHLRVLEASGHVRAESSGRRRHYFPSGLLDESEVAAFALLQNDAAQRVAGLIRARPGVTLQRLADALGVTEGAIRFQARRLSAAGLIRRERQGREMAYWPTGTLTGLDIPTTDPAGPSTDTERA